MKINPIFRLFILIALLVNSMILSASERKDTKFAHKQSSETSVSIESIEHQTELNSKAAQTNPQLEAEELFSNVLKNIDSTLLTEQLQLKVDPTQLRNFVNSKILPYWDVELTLRLLVGSKRWKNLTEAEMLELKRVFKDTLHRYVQEGVKLYDGQRAAFVSAKLKKDDNRKGIITISLEPIYLPAFEIHFKIAKQDDSWKLYDIFVEGISYVKMKKNEYRQIIHKSGIAGLLSYLDNKNLQKS